MTDPKAIKAEVLAIVEIRASDRSWFTARSDEDEPLPAMPAEAADRVIAKLREQGFEARGRLVD